MPLLRLLNTTTFRLAIAYMVLFAVSGFALIGIVYWSTTSFMSRQTDATVAAEIQGLVEQYQTGGIQRLISVIQARSRVAGDSLYLLAEADGTAIVGNLSAWPDVVPDEDGWITLEFERPLDTGPELHQARARIAPVEGRFRILVGRDIEQRMHIVATIRNSLGWALAITAALGLLGGALLARYTMGRLDEINRTSRRIIQGDLSRRVPVRGSGDELDQTADNLNAMLDQIERLMMGMRQVTDNIAHDLRSPLNRLRNRIEVTLMEARGDEAYRAALESTIDEADELINTFNALLSIARVEAGALREDMSELDLSQLARDVAELYEPLAEERGIELAAQVSEGLRLRGNRELLSQSIANLVDNAIKYSPSGAKVTLRVTPMPDNAVRIEVADQGPGIPAGERENVTKRFVRLEESRSEPGVGLGLSLVAAVVRLHHGALELSDPAEGSGLLVVVELPLA